jgi:hypothetical protein
LDELVRDDIAVEDLQARVAREVHAQEPWPQAHLQAWAAR